jgi:transposase
VTVSELGTLSALLGPDQPPARVAIEACREAWFVHDMLVEWGNEVLLVDTTRSRQMGIGQHGRKTDKLDAELLARAVEKGSIPLAHVLSPARREMRRVLAVRRALVETRAQTVTTLRGLLREQGLKGPRCTPETFVRRVRSLELSDELKQLLEPLLCVVEQADAGLTDTETRLSQLCAEEPVVVQLATAPGVGLVVAACIVAVLDDAGRFQRAHQVESYAGLVPSENTTGGKRRLGAISKAGNTYLRALLVQAAWVILRSNDNSDPLHLWAKALAERRGKRIAVVALARRLIGVLWAMWRDGTVYDAQHLAQQGARGLRGAQQTLRQQQVALERAAQKRSVRRPRNASQKKTCAATAA